MVDRNRCDALSITGRREVTRSANPCRRCRPGRGALADHHQLRRRSRPLDGIPASGSEATWPGTRGRDQGGDGIGTAKRKPAAAATAVVMIYFDLEATVARLVFHR
jgi:hypothetical protein